MGCGGGKQSNGESTPGGGNGGGGGSSSGIRYADSSSGSSTTTSSSSASASASSAGSGSPSGGGPPGELGAKIVLLGEMSAGKTCIAQRLVKNTFLDRPEPTIGAAFLLHKIRVSDQSFRLEIWDTAGQERYRALAPMYYRGSAAALIVFDITKKESFEAMKRWVDELRLRASPSITIAIVGNKTDLECERVITREQAEEFVRKTEDGSSGSGGSGPVGVFYSECSAKTGTGIRELFEKLCTTLQRNGSLTNSSQTSKIDFL
ncbi:rab family protein [Pelomyxa schiedti]|nr:rab family protein [Pelomyxa schiedti]